ncbi:MAG: hypothetical protein IPJ20_26250 [Flammeovirgaceae bacterium]|nr:hypothetical protein [Flammeovirgaceae bacterium]
MDEVYFFNSEGKQTFVYWETIQRSLIEYTLKELEELLPKQTSSERTVNPGSTK